MDNSNNQSYFFRYDENTNQQITETAKEITGDTINYFQNYFG